MTECLNEKFSTDPPEYFPRLLRPSRQSSEDPLSCRCKYCVDPNHLHNGQGPSKYFPVGWHLPYITSSFGCLYKRIEMIFISTVACSPSKIISFYTHTSWPKVGFIHAVFHMEGSYHYKALVFVWVCW